MSGPARDAEELPDGSRAVLLDVRHVSQIPTEIQLLPIGVTETTKGPVVFDEIAGDMVVAAFEASGLDLLPFDANHGMLRDGAHPDASKALGWFVPESRPDGLYAARIEWTDSGAEALQKREYRFFSPAMNLEPETNRVKRLINVALTNLPATRRQRPLVASETQQDPHMQILLDALSADNEAEGVASVKRLTGLADVALLLGDSPESAGAAFKALQTKASASDALALKLQKLESDASERAHSELITELSEAGKLAPALHDWARSVPLEQLKAFGELAPSVGGERVVEPVSSEKPTELSADESRFAQALGIDLGELIEFKAAQAAKEGR